MTAVYLAERPVRSFPQIERPGPKPYAAERPFSSRAFGVLPPYLPDVAGLFDFDIQLSAVHSEIHIWGAAMPVGIQLSATAYPIEYATAEFTTSVELEVGKLAEYPFAIELSATVKMVADAAYQQAIDLAATAYPIEIQTGPLTLATALSASAYPVELQTAVDNVALQLSASGYPVEISSASASLATSLTAAGYPIELGGTVSQAIAVEFTATAYESVFALSGITKNGDQTLGSSSTWIPITSWTADAGSTLVGDALRINGSGNSTIEVGSSWTVLGTATKNWRVLQNGVVVWTKGATTGQTFTNTFALTVADGDLLTVEGWNNSGVVANRVVASGSGTYLRMVPV